MIIFRISIVLNKKISSTPMDFEEERILIERESAKQEEKIKNQLLRDLKYLIKVEGFGKIPDCDVGILKVFLGYVIELGLFNDLEMIDALIISIKESNFTNKIEKILTDKITQSSDIIELLSNNKIIEDIDRIF